MWCRFDPEQEKLIQESVSQKVRTYIDSSASVDPIAFMRQFYKERLSRGDSENKAAKIVAYVPQVFRMLLGVKEYTSKLNIPNFNLKIIELEDKVKASPEYLNAIVTDEDYISDIFKPVTDQDIINTEAPIFSISNPKVVVPAISYRPSALFTTTGNQTDPEDFSYKVQTYLLDLLGSDESLDLKNIYLSISSGEEATAIITNSEGKPLYFSPDFSYSTDSATGQTIQFPIRKPEKRMTPQEFAKILKKESSLTDEEALSEAKRIYKQEEDEYTAMMTYLADNPGSSILASITGGSRGFVNFDPTKRKFYFDKINEPYNPGAPDLQGRVEMQVPFIDQPIEVKSDSFSPEKIVAIAKLLTEPVYKADGSKLTISEVKELLTPLLFSRPDGIDYNKIDTENNIITIAHVDYNYKTDKLGVQEAITRHLSNSFVQKVPVNGDLYKNSLPIFTAFDFTTGKPVGDPINNISFNGRGLLFTDGQYRLILTEKVQLNSNYVKAGWSLIKDFTVAVDKSKNVLNENPKSYIDWMKENTYTEIVPDSNGRLTALNGYLRFVPDKSVIKSLGDTTEAPKLSKDYLDQIDQISLDKRLVQKSMNQELGADKAKEAKNWFNNTSVTISVVDPSTGKLKQKKTTLAELWPVEEVFRAVNSSSPSAIATWTNSGITLYKGSDYTDLYHEAWHGFTHSFMNKTQRDELYNETAKQKGSFIDYNGNKVKFTQANPTQLEEYLAEEFRAFALSKGAKSVTGPKRQSWFKKIWNWLQALFQKTILEDTLLAPKSVPMIQDLFEKFYSGDVTQFTYNENSTGDLFHKTIIPLEDNMEDLFTVDQALLITSSIDALMSIQIDRTNTERNTKAYTSALLKSKAGMNAVYGEVKKTFYSNLVDLTNKFNTLYGDKPLEGKELRDARRLQSQIMILKDAYQNYSDNEEDYSKSTKGVVAYHRKRSKFLSYEEKMAKLDNDTPEVRVDKSSQQKSLYETATQNTLYLLRGLIEYDNTGNIQTNDLGFPKLLNLNDTIYHLGVFLENNIGGNDIYERLNAEKSKPTLMGNIARQVLDKIGSPNTNSRLEQAMWSSFISDFSRTRINLRISTFVKDDAGNFIMRSSTAALIDKGVENKFNNHFISVGTNPFMKKDSGGGNYLDIAQLASKYNLADGKPDVKLIKSDPVKFLYNFGIPITNNEAVRKALARNDKPLLMLPRIAARITKQNALIKEYAKLKAIGGRENMPRIQEIQKEWRAMGNRLGIDKAEPVIVRSIYDLFRNERSSLKILTQIEIDQGGASKTLMVETAEGEVAFLHSENSSHTNMINALNHAKSYDELKTLPGMQMFDKVNNPMITNSILLNSLFDFSKPGGPKRVVNGEPVTFVLENLNGIRFTDESGSYGINSFAAEEVDRLVSDLETFMQTGFASGLQHGDKKSTYRMGVSSIVNFNSLDTKFYIAPESFRIIDSSASNWKNQLTYIVGNEIQDELSRVLIMRSVQNMSEEDKANNVYYKTRIGKDRYSDVGSTFVGFKDILSNEVQKGLYDLDMTKIQEAGNLNDYLMLNDPDLLVAMKNDIIDYFDKMSDRFIGRIMDQGLNLYSIFTNETYRGFLSKLKGLDPTIVAKGQRDQIAMLKAFWVNDWIHKHENLKLLYGDIAQYNHGKDEFHKRDSGGASTKANPRDDSGFINYINNNQVFENYVNSPAFNGDRSKVQNQQFTGIWKSAVMQDPVVKSLYFNDLVESLKADLLKKDHTLSEAEAKKIATARLQAYEEMKEADGQGWITLPAYKVLCEAIGEKWSDSQEALYRRIISGELADTESVLEYFPVKKMQMWGPLATEGIPVFGFHKFSLMPLLPNVIRNTNMQALHDRMIEQNVHYAMVQSASKIAHIAPADKPADQFYVGNVNERKTAFADPNYTFEVNPVYSQYFGEQVATNAAYKNKVTFSTQLKKLVEVGLLENGIPTDYTGSKPWDDLSETQKLDQSANYRLSRQYLAQLKRLVDKLTVELREDFGLDAEFKPVDKNYSKLFTKIKDALSEKDLAEHELDNIREGTDLSIIMNPQAIEKIVTALANKRIIKPKLTGEALILASTSGYENPIARKPDFTNPTAEQKAKYGTDGLAFYQPGPDGKTRAMKVKVALAGDFKKLLYLQDTDGVRFIDKTDPLASLNAAIKDDAWLDTDEHRQMVTMIGVRIPVQGPNSMEFMEVWEFLPESAGNFIISPSEIVAKSGGDFDIDKLTILTPNISKIGKKVEITKDSKLDTSLVELKAEKKQVKAAIRELTDKYNRQYKELEASGKLAFTEAQEAQLQELYEKSQEQIRSVEKTMGLANEEDLDKMESKIDELNDQFIKARKELIKSFKLANPELQSFFQQKDAELQSFKDQLEDVDRKIDQRGYRGVQNELMMTMRTIMERPDNYISLFLPNGTYLLDHLAKGELNEEGEIIEGKEGLQEFTRDYDPRRVFRPENYKGKLDKNGKIRKGVSPTRVYEYEFNEAKRSWNNVGMAGLGIAATENTANVAFNSVGMYVSPFTYTRSGKPRKEKLLLPHNTMTVEHKGNMETAISLSNLNDIMSENNIAEVISQLMNGLVDVAKDTWIFDIQGNKLALPTLLFMVQAGIPVDQAVYFISQPAVRQYIQMKKNASAMRADLFNMDVTGKYWEQEWHARKRMFDLYPQFFQNRNVDKITLPKDVKGQFDNQDRPLIASVGWIFKNGQQAVIDEYENADKSFMDTDELRNNIVNNAPVDQQQIDMLLHFMHMEDMANKVSKLKNKTRFDTNQDTTYFDIVNTQAGIAKLSEEQLISTEMVTRFLKETPVGMFNLESTVIKMFGENLTPFRTHPVLIDYIRGLLADYNFRNAVVDNTYYTDQEEYIINFINGLVPFIFQNTLSLMNTTGDTYKGNIIDDKGRLEERKNLGIVPTSSARLGAWVKNGVMYIDKDRLQKQYVAQAYTVDKAEALNRITAPLGLTVAPVKDVTYFLNQDDYNRFVMERELLRSIYSTSDTYKPLYEFKLVLAKQQLGNRSLEDPKSEEQLLKDSYEIFLRDKALNNIFNFKQLFYSDNSYAERVDEITKAFPELKAKYPLLDSLTVKFTFAETDKAQANPMKTLQLNVTKMDGPMVETFNDNLNKLQDSSIEKHEDPIINDYISDLFKQFSVFAFLQSGQQSVGRNSLGRIIANNPIVPQLLEKPLSYFSSQLNKDMLNVYKNKFDSISKRSQARFRYYAKDYRVSSKYDIDTLRGVKHKYVPTPALKYTLEPSGTVGLYSIHSEAKSQDIKASMRTLPADVMPVYNKGIFSPIFTGDPSNWFGASDVTNTIGIRTYRGNKPGDVGFTPLTLSNQEQLEVYKGVIDKDIAAMQAQRDAGKVLIFSQNGYGQELLLVDNAFNKDAFNYLSQRLFEEFGHQNKGYYLSGVSRETIDKFTYVSDQDVIDYVKQCFK